MTTSFTALRTLCAGALLLASTACGSAPSASTPAASISAAALLPRIEAERGKASCDTTDQCHTIGVGAKACGGPERYLAWSSKDNDGNRLKALVQQHAELRRAEDAKAGMMSTCIFLPDPGATCQAGQCVVLPAGQGASLAR
jgi:hypothetical protein